MARKEKKKRTNRLPGAPVAGKPAAFENCFSDPELAHMRGVTTRTQSRERRLGIGPPFLRDGRRVWYPIPGWHQYLADQGRQTRRAGRGGHASPP
jgi:hypothetical protein